MGRLLLFALALAGCQQVFGLDEPRMRDGGARDAPGDAAPDAALGPWSEAQPITELTSAGGDDDPSLTLDELEIVFGSVRAGGLGGEDIWTATRNSPSEAWGTPTAVTALNTAGLETTPRITLDGLTIFFSSDRLGSDVDVWFSTRPSRTGVWAPPVRIAEISLATFDYGASAADSLKHLVMCAGADVPTTTMYMSDRADVNAPWGPPVKITELDNTSGQESDPYEANPNSLYFSMDVTGTNDSHDLYVSHPSTADGTYGKPLPLVGPNTTNFQEKDPWVSPDERLLVFSSNRNGNSALFYSTR